MHKDDVFAIRDLLLTLGYEPKRAQNEEQEKLLFRRYKDYGFVHPEKKHVIEVHWSVVERQFSTLFDRELFLPTQRHVEIATVPFSVMDAEEMLIILCAHGALHEWDRLKWLCDVHELIYSTPEVDWAVAASKARKWKVEKLLYLGLVLTHECLGTEVPSAILFSAQRNASVDRLRRHVLRNYEADLKRLSVQSLDRVYYQANLPDKWYDRIRYLWIVVFNTNMNDVHFVTLPSWLSPLYVLLRPLRLIHKWGLWYLAKTVYRMMNVASK